ncbi:MAG: alpha-hydroxy-acid oxidizing protein [Planctomycetota bacterium]|nr:MAG: alpha-hydroxy-acid oxidizing protein [Planctomycetota bacterium]
MQPINLQDYEELARERLPQVVFDYYFGGAEDELTVAENRASWQRIRLRPRVLADVGTRDLKTTVLGADTSMPVMLAPCGFNALAHAEGELAVTRAAAAAGVIHVVSTAGTHSLEDVAAAAPNGTRWFQLYCYRDRDITRWLIDRAAQAGYRALCLTVDAPLVGKRERDARNRFGLPHGMGWKNLEGVGLERMDVEDEGSALAHYVSKIWDPALTWDAVGWLCEQSSLPLVIKGILTGEDAQRAVDHGAQAIVVSNHGGRQLDGAVPTSEALVEVADAVGDRVEIIVDGGIRRGSHVLKALALGARAVLVGRPYLWALAAGGQAGVEHMLAILREELDLDMALAGRPTIASIDRTLVSMPSQAGC